MTVVQSVNNLSEPQSTVCLNEFDKSCTKGKDGKYYDAQDEVKEKRLQNSVDGSKDGSGSSLCISGDALRDDTSRSHSEGGFNDEMIAPTVSSHLEDVPDMECAEKVDSASHLDLGLIGQHFDSRDCLEEQMDCDNPVLSLAGGSDSTKAKIDSESLDSLSSEIPLSDPSNQACISDSVGIYSQHLGNISSQPTSCDDRCSFSDSDEVNISLASSSSEVQEKLENICLNEPGETMEGGNSAEDDGTCFYPLHNTRDPFPSDLGQSLRSDLTESDGSDGVNDNLPLHLGSEPSDLEKKFYDPSLWTPMEMETATGKADCTYLEHNLKLRSTYTEVEVEHIFLSFLCPLEFAV